MINNMAKEMGLSIRFPVTASELPFRTAGNMYCMTHGGVLVDDADDVLAALIGMPVIRVSASGKMVSAE